MRVAILPFFSQQNKMTGKFVLGRCCVVSICSYLAWGLARAGHDVRIALPTSRSCEDPFTGWSRDAGAASVVFDVPPSNLEQRLMFDPVMVRYLCEKADVFVTHNEIATWRARAMFPDLKIVQFNHLLPVGQWAWMKQEQLLSWRAADLVVFLSESLRSFARFTLEAVDVESAVWPMVYDRDTLIFNHLVKTIDVLFVQRCSASNYTHHREFLRAAKALRAERPGLRIVFTDPTRYLEANEMRLAEQCGAELAHADSREDYARLLAGTRVVVALMDGDLHGGIAIREAIVSGAIPVLLRAQCYEDMLGPQAPRWPHMVGSPLDETLAPAIVRALDEPPPEALSWIRWRVGLESYQNAFDSFALPALERLGGAR